MGGRRREEEESSGGIVRMAGEVHEEATEAREHVSELKLRRQEQAAAKLERLKQAYLRKMLEKLKATSGDAQSPDVTARRWKHYVDLFVGDYTRAWPTLHVMNHEPEESWIHWIHAPENKLKLNIDVSALGNPGPAWFGDLIRNNAGNWKGSFICNRGTATNLAMELFV